ncbi:thiolase family protein [Staphylococcus massiliensis]|uniref:thiolase family protein n=1 Tax=Staphylococcus massiliensis TaxID=555791 RepID=UPI001EDE5ECF|nr:thiolase family protein [Staphylococcus massiliensis]MCG3401946.1 thiolase family protein [Staphylococcus massiliensis]MCG3412391.1 thiolase family protein [Staphylococcus massiliensis]
MNQPIIVYAKRTPIGKYGGMLSHIEPEYLVKALIEDLRDTHPTVVDEVNDVILGNVVGNGGNIARKALLEAGLSETIPGMTIDRQCGSGLEAIHTACRMIQAGAGDMYIAGGVESTSRAPWKIKRPQSVYETAMPEIFERAAFAPDGMDPSMIEAAENVAKQYGICREDQDQFAYDSHQKTLKAVEAGFFEREIVPLRIKGTIVTHDESVKPRLTMRILSRFKPLLAGGTVTVGNSCMKNDGAGIVLVMRADKARDLGIKEGLQFINASVKGVDPTLLGIGPIPAVKDLLKKEGLEIEDIDAVEFNEAFSSQVLASTRALNIPMERLNQYGGALATGHPYGASGALLVCRLFHMAHCRFGLATLGIGGGIGHATLFRRWKS